MCGVWRGCLLLLLLATSSGCSRSGATLAPVRGRVAYRGMVLRAGSIVFSPDADRGTRGPLARADIRPDGTFQLMTGEAPGAVPGWHRVTIAAVEPVMSYAPDQPFASPRSLLPEKYRAPDLSGLLCEVQKAKENEFNFNLE